MATKNMAYDHPAYLVPQSVGGTTLAGSGTQFKFCAWTTMLLKSVQMSADGGGTGAAQDIVLLHKINGTTTTSLGNIGTWTAAQVTTKNYVGTHTFTLGEVAAITKGTDATVKYGVGMEFYLVPGANVTG